MDDKIMEVFEFGRIQECVNIKLKLDEHGISWDEFVEWVKDAAKRHVPAPRNILPPIDHSVLSRECPDCKQFLYLDEVNNNTATQVGGNFKCQWLCYKCGWEELSELEIQIAAQPYIRPLEVIYVPVDGTKGCD